MDVSTGLILSIDVDGVVTGVKKAEDSLTRLPKTADNATRDFNKHLESIKKSGDSLTSTIEKLKIAAAGLGVAFAFHSLIDTMRLFQQIDTTLVAVTGNTSKAADQMAFIRGIVDRLGLDLGVAAEQYAAMVAASKNTRLEGVLLQEVFTGVSEELAALHKPASAAQGVLVQLQQIISKQVVNWQDLKAAENHLPDLMQMVAKGTGKTTAELFDLMSKGKLLAADVLPAMARAMHDQYGKAAEQAAFMTQGLTNKLNTSILDLKKIVIDSGFEQGFGKGIEAILKTLKSDDVKRLARELGESLASAGRFAADALEFVSQHMDKVIGLARLFIGYKIAMYFLDIKDAVFAATTALKEYAVASVAANTATSRRAAANGLAIGGAAAPAATAGMIANYTLAIASAAIVIAEVSKLIIGESSDQDVRDTLDKLNRTPESRAVARRFAGVQAEAPDQAIVGGHRTTVGPEFALTVMHTVELEQHRIQAERDKDAEKEAKRREAAMEQMKQYIQQIDEVFLGAERKISDRWSDLIDKIIKTAKTAGTSAIDLSRTIFLAERARDKQIQEERDKQIKEAEQEADRGFKEAMSAMQDISKFQTTPRNGARFVPDLAAQQKTIEKMPTTIQRTIDLVGGLQDSFSQMFSGIALGTRNLADVWRGVADSIVAEVGRIIAKMTIMYFLQQLMGVAVGSFTNKLNSPTNIQASRTFAGNQFLARGAPFAMGGIMTDHGPLPLNRYEMGGIANSPQMAIFGEGRRPEAYVPLPDGRSIPVTMNQQQQNLRVVLINKTSSQVQTSQGNQYFDSTLKEMVTEIILEDKQRNGAIRRSGG